MTSNRKHQWITKWMEHQKTSKELQQLDKDTRQPNTKNNIVLHIQPDLEKENFVKITCKTKSIGCLRDDVILRKRSRGLTFRLIDCYMSTLRVFLEEHEVIEPEINNKQSTNSNTPPTLTSAQIPPQGVINENNNPNKKYGREFKNFLNRI